MGALHEHEEWPGESDLTGQIRQAELRLTLRRHVVRTQRARLARDLRRRLHPAVTLLTLLSAALVGVAAERAIRRRARAAPAAPASPGITAAAAAMLSAWLRTTIVGMIASAWRGYWQRTGPVDPAAQP